MYTPFTKHLRNCCLRVFFATGAAGLEPAADCLEGSVENAL